MKKVLFAVMLLFAGLTSASAQDIYKEIVHMSDSVANDESKLIDVRRIAKFKSNALKYWAGKLMMEQMPEGSDGNIDLNTIQVPDSVWRELDNQAISLYNYVHLYQTRLLRAEKEKDRLRALYPHKIGMYKDEPVCSSIGRYGPYLTYRNENFRLPKNTDPLSMSLEEAVDIILSSSVKKPRGRKKKTEE